MKIFKLVFTASVLTWILLLIHLLSVQKTVIQKRHCIKTWSFFFFLIQNFENIQFYFDITAKIIWEPKILQLSHKFLWLFTCVVQVGNLKLFLQFCKSNWLSKFDLIKETMDLLAELSNFVIFSEYINFNHSNVNSSKLWLQFETRRI